ncbi:MAG: hypothetical protein CVV49_15895 [Spirochaetae bacterium HGW-Spirochaetae-5]|nr:MAG: hypothetical protein CVV49_15895 [Spirochaetae bacterium HGW-Spirochaetae-5]
MKKIVIIISMLMLLPLMAVRHLQSALLTDINGVHIDLGDEGYVTGGGLSLLWDMPRYFDNERVYFYINSTFAFNVEKRDKPAETVRSYYPVSAGIEYRHHVTTMPLYITGSAGAGASYFRKEGPAYTGMFMDPSKTQIDSEFGPYCDIMLGVNFVLSQNTAFFARGGYQKSFYNDDLIESPSGMQFNLGFRIPISGNFKNLD